jgi:6-pyruvoyltetrahydropterin/6-carboxytetrahydropterin synthase
MAAELRVRMARRVAFSSGHRYWDDSLDANGNRAKFGAWASPFNHGHNYGLEVTVEGAVEAATGMMLNIKRIDDLLKGRVLDQVDGKSLNDQVARFKSQPPTLENLMVWIWGIVADREGDALPVQVELKRVRLEETPLLFGELEVSGGGQLMTLTRVYEFAASHRLHSKHLSPEENVELFGKCNNAAGHGHNYVVEITVEGTPDPKTGMLVDLAELDRQVDELVLQRYDHKNLNVDVQELSGLVPTSENVASAIFSALDGRLPAKLFRVRLHETARNMFEVYATG